MDFTNIIPLGYDSEDSDLGSVHGFSLLKREFKDIYSSDDETEVLFIVVIIVLMHCCGLPGKSST